MLVERSSPNARAAVTLIVLAIPGALYWLIGDISEPGEQYSLDYMWRSPVSETTAKVAGVVSVATIVGAAVYVCLAQRWKTTHQLRWVGGLLGVTGALLAVGARVTTAGGGGANIGGGLFLLVGLPVCAVLVVCAGAIAYGSRRSSAPIPPR